MTPADGPLDLPRVFMTRGEYKRLSRLAIAVAAAMPEALDLLWGRTRPCDPRRG